MQIRVLLTSAALAAARLSAAADNRPPIDFGRDIQPILSDNCFHCHGPDPKNRKGGLRLDEERAVKTGKDGNPAVVVAGKSAESELYRRLISTDTVEVMPPPKSNRKLTADQITRIKQWIDSGAAWGGHWAFTAPQRPAVPKPVKFAGRVVNPIDAFILSRLEREGLSPSPPASPETIIRRMKLDLTGLPPTPEDVKKFNEEHRAGPQAAIEALADRLLASPAFGERMAWDWLDAVRYADTNGYQGDSERTMWPWRDWVVDAFNRNLPFDQFTAWQLAGDLLPAATEEQKLATAFCRNHMINGEGGRIAEENRVDYVLDMTETTATVWLGLTFTCCRCHDHKFDPFSRKDYYRLFAYFNRTPVDGGGGNPQQAPVLERTSPEQKAKLAEAAGTIRGLALALEVFEAMAYPRPGGKPADASGRAAMLPDPVKAVLRKPPGERSKQQLSDLEKHFGKDSPDYVAACKKLRTAIESREGLSKSVVRVMVMEDTPKPRKTFMLEKGLYNKPGDEVTAGVPAKLPQPPEGDPGNRLGLARWLTSAENPLTARVTVNRLWQQIFGVGLVKTPEDFGVQGEKPVHPELLDWLAVEFRESGWDVKRLIKLLVTSSTYCQSLRVAPGMAERDPLNRLLARGARFRMPSWMIRDQALAASGLLANRIGGPPVKPYQPAGIWEEATFGGKQYKPDKGEVLYRRSLYVYWRRIVGPTMFFDSNPRQTCAVKQPRTNTPLHALATLNDVTYVEAARALAERAMAADAAPEKRLDSAFRLVLARPPTPSEAKVLLAGLERLRADFTSQSEAAKRFLRNGESKRNEALDPIEHASWAALCLGILNLDEALTKE